MFYKTVRSLGFFLGSLLLGSALLFGILHLAPGDVAQIHNLSPQTARSLHLNRPLVIQYLFWLGNCLRLNFGISMVDGTPVASLLREYAPTTFFLTIGSLLLSLLLAIPIGMYRGLKPAAPLGKILSTLVYTVSSVPVFVLGYIVLAIAFGFFHVYITAPPEGSLFQGGQWGKWAAYYLLPVGVLALGNGALGEFVRFIALEAQNTNGATFIQAARARGVALGPHFFRSLLLPMFSITVTQVALLLGGLVVVERVFNFHGLGWLSWEATLKRDFPVLMGIALVMGVLVRFLMLLNELLAQWMDPRLRGDRAAR